MINANELKSGSLYVVNGTPHMVESVFKQTPSARGAVTLYKVRARNLLTKTKIDQTYHGDDVFPEPNYSRIRLQYLYRSGEFAEFMDTESFDQYQMSVRDIATELNYLTDGMEGISGLVLDERLAGIQLPDVVELSLAECEPSIRGASATARTKPAQTETGLTVHVPEYMDKGERVRVDTRDGRFLGRA